MNTNLAQIILFEILLQVNYNQNFKKTNLGK